jgi:hypothetical protein
MNTYLVKDTFNISLIEYQVYSFEFFKNNKEFMLFCSHEANFFFILNS